MPKTALLIDTDKRTITPFQCRGYEDMVKHMPGGICIAWVFHEHDGDVLYVDDEGLLRPATTGFRIKDREDGQPMMGHGILTGRDDAKMVDGELIETSLDPTMTPAMLQERIEWLTVEESLEWFRAQRGQPATTFQELGKPPVILKTWSAFLDTLEPK